MARSARLPMLQRWRALPTAIAVAKVDHSDTTLLVKFPVYPSGYFARKGWLIIVGRAMTYFYSCALTSINPQGSFARPSRDRLSRAYDQNSALSSATKLSFSSYTKINTCCVRASIVLLRKRKSVDFAHNIIAALTPMGVCVCTNIDICSCGGGVAASSISTPGNSCDRIGIAKLAS